MGTLNLRGKVTCPRSPASEVVKSGFEPRSVQRPRGRTHQVLESSRPTLSPPSTAPTKSEAQAVSYWRVIGRHRDSYRLSLNTPVHNRKLRPQEGGETCRRSHSQSGCWAPATPPALQPPTHLSQTRRRSAPGARRGKAPGQCRAPHPPCRRRTPSGLPGGLRRGSAGVLRVSVVSLRRGGAQCEL